jgi:lipoate-protein ligase A
MSVTVLEYDLPDAFLFKTNTDGFLVWQPESYYIVLGQSNSVEGSLLTDNVMLEGIPVTRRPSGGEAVMLTPSTIAVSVARSFQVMIQFREFFRMINGVIIDCLSNLGVRDLSLKGISDIAIGDRKILGSSMANHRSRLVYHAVINVGEDPSLFERYLLHPHREPGYRSGRRHGEFVTSLKKEGYDFASHELIEAMSGKISSFISGASSPVTETGIN